MWRSLREIHINEDKQVMVAPVPILPYYLLKWHGIMDASQVGWAFPSDQNALNQPYNRCCTVYF